MYMRSMRKKKKTFQQQQRQAKKKRKIETNACPQYPMFIFHVPKYPPKRVTGECVN